MYYLYTLYIIPTLYYSYYYYYYSLLTNVLLIGRSDSLQAADVNKMNVKVLDIVQDIDAMVYRANYIWDIYKEAIHRKYNNSLSTGTGMNIPIESRNIGFVSVPMPVSIPVPTPLMRTQSGNHQISNETCKYTYVDVNVVITSDQ